MQFLVAFSLPARELAIVDDKIHSVTRANQISQTHSNQLFGSMLFGRKTEKFFHCRFGNSSSSEAGINEKTLLVLLVSLGSSTK